MQILIIEACTIAGEETSSHADVGAVLEVSKEDAGLLTRTGRALYTSRDDDPTKGTLTATAEDKSAVKKRIAAMEAERKAREAESQAQTPAGMAAMVAAAVAQAVQAALQQPAADTPKA